MFITYYSLITGELDAIMIILVQMYYYPFICQNHLLSLLTGLMSVEIVLVVDLQQNVEHHCLVQYDTYLRYFTISVHLKSGLTSGVAFDGTCPYKWGGL